MLILSFLSESDTTMFDEEEEQREAAEVMEVDKLIQQEMGGWMEVQPHAEEKEKPKVSNAAK